MSVTIDGVDLKDLGIRVLLDLDYPATPKTRDKTVTIPDKHGEYDFGAYFGALPHELECRVFRQGNRAIQQVSRELKELLLDEEGRPKTVELRYTFEPEKYYNVRLRGNIPLQRLVMMGEFTLPLTAHDPFAYASYNAYDEPPGEYDTGLQYDSGLMYENPSTVTWQYPIQYSGLHNYSYYKTPLNFMIEGEVTNPRLNLNGDMFKIDVTLQANERLYVDSKTEQVWVVEMEHDIHGFLTPVMLSQSSEEWQRMNLYGNFSGDFPYLKQGDNDLKFEGGQPSAMINLDWQHKFM